MSTPQVQLNALKTGWDSCRGLDDQKHSLITDLFTYIKDLSDQLAEAEAELRDKKDVIKMIRFSVDESQKQVQVLQHEKARYGFVSVLIDGDSMPFKDDLVKQGMDGGKRTAKLLQQALKEEFQVSNPAAAHHIQVIVRVYANVKGLANVYKELALLPELTSFDEFIRGFNMGDVTCDYIDAGTGKECSDEKIRATFRRDIDDVHCQRVFFGGSADNGYARLLQPFVEDESVCSRITLVEGSPFARELAEIKDRFRTVSFDDVFRKQKLVNMRRRVSFNLTPPSTPSTCYASAVAHTTSTPAAASANPQGSTVSSALVPGKILRNALGQRVDSALNYSQADFLMLKDRKLCNRFLILGRCKFLESFGKCDHNHKASLSNNQMVALRAVSRQSACPSGLRCKDVDCIYGHRCTRSNCVRETCRFSPAMHDVDTIIATQL